MQPDVHCVVPVTITTENASLAAIFAGCARALASFALIEAQRLRQRAACEQSGRRTAAAMNWMTNLRRVRKSFAPARVVKSGFIFGAMILAAVASAPDISKADEGGVSFWLPGLFGSLAAVPQQPGWSAASIYYHTTVSAGGDVARAREITIGRIPANLTANLNASLNATGDIGLVIPTYVFATPVFGGQASVGVLAYYGTASASVGGTLTGTLALPGGITIPFGPRTDSINS